MRSITYLHYAAHVKNVEMSISLLKFGADPFKKSRNQQTSVEIWPELQELYNKYSHSKDIVNIRLYHNTNFYDIDFVT